MPAEKHPSTDPQRSDTLRRKHLLLLLLGVALAYVSAVPGGFIWTDQDLILAGGARITSGADFAALFTLTDSQFAVRLLGDIPPDPAGGWWPATILSQSLDWLLWRDCASCVRIENLLWHFIAVTGLYALGRHLLSHRRHGRRIAFWAALAFAVHPLGVSVVSWPGGRPVLLGAVGAIWALVMFTRLPAVHQSRPGKFKHTTVLVWLVALTLLATTSHELAFVLPIAVGAVIWLEMRERGQNHPRFVTSARWIGLGVVVATCGLVLGYRFVAFGGISLAEYYPAQGIGGSLGSALNLLWHHIGQTLLPGEPTASDAFALTGTWGPREYTTALGTILLVGGVLVPLVLLHHPAAWGVAWFLLWQLPGSGFFPGLRYQTEASLYPASWGMMLALAFVIMQLWRPVGRQLARGMETLVYLPPIIILVLITAFSNARWWDNRTLFESELDLDPNYVEGRLLLARLALQEHQAEIALNHALRALAISGERRFSGYHPPGLGARLAGEAQLALDLPGDALRSAEAALAATPHLAASWHLRGRVRMQAGDHTGAESDLREALRRRPGWKPAQFDLGLALILQGRIEDGMVLLQPALEDPGGLSPHQLRHGVEALVGIGQQAVAIRWLLEALSQDDDSDARARLAMLYWRQGQQEEARRQLQLALDHKGEVASALLIEAEQLVRGGN